MVTQAAKVSSERTAANIFTRGILRSGIATGGNELEATLLRERLGSRVLLERLSPPKQYVEQSSYFADVEGCSPREKEA